MRGWMIYLVLGGTLDLVGGGLFLTHLGQNVGVYGMMALLVGVVLTRGGVLLMRRDKGSGAVVK
jgi:hypothetical protein